MLVILILEGSIFVFTDWSLNLIERLLDKTPVLNVQDTIRVAFNIRVVGHHDASRRCPFALALGADSVDIQDQIHDGHYNN